MKWKQQSRAFKVTLLLAALALCAVYIGIAIYYRMHFYPNTLVGELSVSGMTPAQVEASIQKEVEDYKLILKEREGKDEEILGASVSLTPDLGMAIEDALAEQTGFGWIVHFFVQNKMDRQPVAYDQEQLNAMVENLSCVQKENQTAPQDASLAYEDGSYHIVPEVYGTTVKKDVLKQVVQEAVENLDESVDLSEAGCYQDPEILQEDENLLKALQNANVCIQAEITYQAGEKQLQCSAEQISKMLIYDEEGNISLDGEALDAFLKRLDAMFSTLGKTKKFKTSYGKTVTITRSDYGWKVDIQAEAEALQEAILSGTVESRKPHFSQKAASYGTYDYGDTYVEINLTAQHLFLYVKGKKVMETDFVSGNESNGNATRLGMMMLKYKQKNAVLRGDDYETPVNYWMPFDGNIGMHDATWRSKFGGNIYKTAGSHGCINLPLSAAKTIFENIQPGNPVIVYKLKGTEPKETKKEEKTGTKKTSTKTTKSSSTSKKKTTTQTEEKTSEQSDKQDQGGKQNDIETNGTSNE
ncbi:MAG: peptidoglycan binding domain-containing protein [Lachnospiraceae bacterium]